LISRGEGDIGCFRWEDSMIGIIVEGIDHKRGGIPSYERKSKRKDVRGEVELTLFKSHHTLMRNY
jgi:hypothetical protein